jgi:NhaC family Na+:H+ antiporter
MSGTSDQGSATSTAAAPGRTPRRPTLLEAALPALFLIGLLALTISIFGTDATGGPLQVALLTSAAFAALVSMRLGNHVSEIRDAAVGGISSALSAVFILLAVGALIGTWNMAGVIPTVVYYGLGLLSATFFYPATAIICGVVGLAIGSSWTTAATLGVAFVSLAPIIGVDPVITAGAVISGAYFGDKMTPISETTVLVPSMVGNVTTQEHIGAMIWTSGPAVIIAIVLFTILGLTGTHATTAFDPAQAQATLAKEFAISPINLLPLLLLVFMSLRRWPPFLSIFSCAIFAGVMAWFTQPQAIAAFVSDPNAGWLKVNIEALYSALANGFISNTGNAEIDALFSRGGMSGMLTTIWLVLGALSYAAVMEHAGFLARLIEPVIDAAKGTGSMIAAVIFTCLGLNIIAGDQYVSIVMPSRMYRLEFARRGLAPRMLSRAVEDSGTVTSPLVPWNSCGAYMAGVLGVATAAYLPYCFFNILSPVISLIYGFTGFRIEHLPSGQPGLGPTSDAPAGTAKEALEGAAT